MSLSKDQLQKILQEVRKQATPFGETAQSAPNNAPVHQGVGNKQIKVMQEALIKLAKDVTDQLNVKDLMGANPKKQEAQGRDSFGDFMTKHYLRNSNVPGVEYSPDPTKTKMEDKDPRAPNKLSWVMDTMRRIGGEKGENFADGVWGPRTNAALHNAYALAQGLLKLSQDFNLRITSFTNNNLTNLARGLPENANDLSTIQKIEIAGQLTPYIVGIQKMYQEIKQSILEKPQYRAYIEGDKPYLHHDNPGIYLSPQQISSIKQTFGNGFSIPLNNQGSVAQITVDNLTSLDALNKWIAQFPDNKLDPYNVLTLVSNQITRKNNGV